MTLPASGNISFRDLNLEMLRSADAPLSLDDPDLRVMANKPTGNISIADLNGKTFEYKATITANVNNLNIQNLFTAAQWTSAAPKRVVISPGVVIGSTSVSTAALLSGTGRGSTLIIENYGSIQGAGGAANGGVGGDAFNAQQSGITFINYSGGQVLAGGGGGGDGGNGGSGSYTYVYREPSSGAYFSTSVPRYFFYGYQGSPNLNTMVALYWGHTSGSSPPTLLRANTTSPNMTWLDGPYGAGWYYGGWWYYKG